MLALLGPLGALLGLEAASIKDGLKRQAVLWGTLGDRFRTAAGEVDFERLFMVPAWLGLAAMVLLLVAFHPRAVAPSAPRSA